MGIPSDLTFVLASVGSPVIFGSDHMFLIFHRSAISYLVAHDFLCTDRFGLWFKSEPRPLILHLSNPDLVLGLLFWLENDPNEKHNSHVAYCFSALLPYLPKLLYLSLPLNHLLLGHCFFHTSNSSPKFRVVRRALQNVLLEDCIAWSLRESFKAKDTHALWPWGNTLVLVSVKWRWW